jgi:hypothetical protein
MKWKNMFLSEFHSHDQAEKYFFFSTIESEKRCAQLKEYFPPGSAKFKTTATSEFIYNHTREPRTFFSLERAIFIKRMSTKRKKLPEIFDR